MVGVGEVRFLGEVEHHGGNGLECVPLLGPEPHGEGAADRSGGEPVAGSRFGGGLDCLRSRDLIVVGGGIEVEIIRRNTKPHTKAPQDSRRQRVVEIAARRQRDRAFQFADIRDLERLFSSWPKDGMRPPKVKAAHRPDPLHKLPEGGAPGIGRDGYSRFLGRRSHLELRHRDGVLALGAPLSRRLDTQESTLPHLDVLGRGRREVLERLSAELLGRDNLGD